jgi:hypothetical protein
MTERSVESMSRGFRVAYQYAEYRPPYRLQEASEFSYPPLKRGRVQADNALRKRSEKKRAASLRKDRSLSTLRSCWKSARVMTSESESFLRDS